MHHVFLTACLWLMALVLPLRAEMRLEDFLAMLSPTSSKQAIVFEYVALPQDLKAGGGLKVYRVPSPELGFALLKPAMAQTATGMDFSKLEAIFSAGELPKDVNVFSVGDGFFDGAEAALLARQFEMTREGEALVFAKGEDFGFDPDRVRGLDPFGHGIGASQRIAKVGDVVVHTRAWPVMRQALRALAEPAECKACSLWQPLVASIRAQMQPQHKIHSAIGLGPEALAYRVDLAELILKPNAIEAIKKKPTEKSPFENVLLPSLATILAVTGDDTEGSVWIAMWSGTEALAQATLSEIANRFTRQISMKSPDAVALGAPVNVGSRKAGEGYVITLKISKPSAIEALRTANQWYSLIQRRDFLPLAWGGL